MGSWATVIATPLTCTLYICSMIVFNCLIILLFYVGPQSAIRVAVL